MFLKSKLKQRIRVLVREALKVGTVTKDSDLARVSEDSNKLGSGPKVYKIIEQEMYSKVLRIFFTYYFPQELITGLVTPRMRSFEKLLYEMMDDGVSIACLDKSTGTLLGVLVNYVRDSKSPSKAETNNRLDVIEEVQEEQSQNLTVLQMNDKNINANKCSFKIFLMATDAETRSGEIENELLRRSLCLANREGCDEAAALCATDEHASNDVTVYAANKLKRLGFQEEISSEKCSDNELTRSFGSSSNFSIMRLSLENRNSRSL